MKRASYHNEKMPELMAHLAAEFIALESNRTSLITVTNCKLSPDNKYGTVFFTVLPDNQEKAAMDFLNRKRIDFKKFVREKSRLGRIPEITFVLDIGEKNRQKIDFLTKND